MNPEGFEYSANVPGRGLCVLELIPASQIAPPGGALFTSINAFGPFDPVDDSARWQAAIASGLNIFWPKAHYILKKGVDFSGIQNAKYLWAPGCIIEAQLARGIFGTATVLFFGSNNVAGPLHNVTSNAGAGAVSLEVDANIPVGSFIVAYPVVNAAQQEMFLVTAVTPSGSNFILTLDRPTRMPAYLAATAVVQTVDGFPRHLSLDFSDSIISGVCQRYFEFIRAWHCDIFNAFIDDSLGTSDPGDVCASWDVPSYECHTFDSQFNQPGGPAMESASSCAYVRCKFQHRGAVSANGGYLIIDSFSCGLVDCEGFDSEKQNAAFSTGGGAGTTGCWDCFVRGGRYSGAAVEGVLVTGLAQRTIIGGGVTCDGNLYGLAIAGSGSQLDGVQAINNISRGVLVGVGGSLNPVILNNVDVTGNLDYGIDSAGSDHIIAANIICRANGQIGASAGVAVVHALSGEFYLTGFSCESGGTAAFFSEGCKMRISAGRVVNTNGAGFIFQTNPGDIVVDMTVDASGAAGLYNTPTGTVEQLSTTAPGGLQFRGGAGTTTPLAPA